MNSVEEAAYWGWKLNHLNPDAPKQKGYSKFCRFHPDRKAVGSTDKGLLCRECLDAEARFHEGMDNRDWSYGQA